MKIHKSVPIGLFIISLSFSSIAGIGEKTWIFEKDESSTFDNTNSGQGNESGCTLFTPKLVSFKVSFTNPDRKPIITIGTSGTVKQTARSEYRIDRTNSLSLGFPAGGAYTVTNETGERIEGHNCDSGIM